MLPRRMRMLLAGVLLPACVPDVEDSDALVTKARVLAVSATPAEAEASDEVSYTALYADASGALSEGPLDWAFCLARKSLAELGPIDPSCLSAHSKSLTSIGDGLATVAALPEDTCRLFGSDRPMGTDDQPAGRPADPDPTGGFYQPVRVFDPDARASTLFESRIACPLAGVTQAQFVEFNTRYRRNQNPAIDRLEILGHERQSVSPAGDADPMNVRPGARLELRLSWSDCSTGNECGDGICGDKETRKDCADDCADAKGCGGSEYFLYFDRVARKFVLRRETLRVSWFATAGSFAEARTGRAAEDATHASSNNQWLAPAKAGDITLFTVLRDDRGGVAWQSYRLRVR